MSSEAAPVTVEVPASESRVRDAYAAVFSRSYVRVLPWYLWAACAYTFIAFVSLVSPKRLFATLNLEFVAVCVFLIFLSFVWVPAWRARVDKANSLLASEPAVWTFTPAGAACSFGEYSKFEAEWRVLYAVERLPHGLLLFAHRIVAHWIPRSAFASDRDFDQVAEWAAFGAPRYRQRSAWKTAEWIASLLIAPPAIALVIYFAIMIRWGQNLLDSYPTLLTVLRFALPSSYATSWVIGVPAHWLIGRLTRRPIFFLAAGVALGAVQSLRIAESVGPFQPGLVEWMAAFGVGALLHWLIVVRGNRADPAGADVVVSSDASRATATLLIVARVGFALFFVLLGLVAVHGRAWVSAIFTATAVSLVITPRSALPNWTLAMRAVACAICFMLGAVFFQVGFRS